MNALSLTFSLLLAMPNLGDVAPEFSAPDTDGRIRTLSDLRHAGPVVLAFFPKAFTSGCTQELTNYTQRVSELAPFAAQVVAISNDDPAKLKKFKDQLKAPYIFIPDEDGKIIALYGVRMFPLKMAKRTTFVIDTQGKVVRVERGGDALDPTSVVNALKALPPSTPGHVPADAIQPGSTPNAGRPPNSPPAP
jgi:peroxiredoxin Q/BCP